ncbi:OmpA family protein [Janthinobacterium sp. 17J80-10]|uniref:OmpA family protein n=1 Tax=Janthinobacterium sp. 17J80-10 TaxID=2497863 RepID=UPI001005913E|nr:OmpA family protein [Janthinobacterium sp. 17J80-10]QAU34381.1 OmpA family protein [Janthinobacterium sp. 17J80-10]
MKKLTLSALAVSIAITGCADMSPTQRGTAQGAGLGALGGAVIGAMTGNSKNAATGAVVGAAAGALAGNIWSSRMEMQKKQMEEATRGTGVEVSQTADNRLKLDIPSDISFDTNRADIKPNFRPILDRFATGLKENPVTNVTIIGHTDSTGSDAINDPLSRNRAVQSREYLTARGVSASRFTVEGRGSHEPVADNATVAGRAQNRRVEIYVAEPAPQGQPQPVTR